LPTEDLGVKQSFDLLERGGREAERRSWEVRMFDVKNVIPDANLQALCIFRIEVVNQPALQMVQVRAPKELLTAIEDAVKRLDRPSPAAPSIELIGYVLVVVEASDPKYTPKYSPLPASLKSVGTQLANILPSDTTLFLADTVVARGLDRTQFSVTGGTTLRATPSVRAVPGGTVVHLEDLLLSFNFVNFSTDIDIPLNTQVVVGKGTPGGGSAQVKAVVLVMTAKVEPAPK
jgi:hypothetical protein